MTEKKIYSEPRTLDTYSCDQHREAKLSGILQITQDAGKRQMDIDKPSYEELQDQGKALMLSRLDLKIYDRIYCDEPVTVLTCACGNSRATFPRMYYVEKDGKLMAEVTSQWALVDMETRKILKADEADFSNFYMGEYKELFDRKFKIPKDAGFETVGAHRVSYSNLDNNGHMNNTFYADVLCDHIPELEAGTHRVSGLRIHYSKEAPLGDVITILRTAAKDGAYMFRTVKENGETNIEAEISLTER